MKYAKCLTCKHLGADCDGANLLIMDTPELREWCEELRKIRPGMTYDKLSGITGVSKTAVYNFLHGTGTTECRIDTARLIAKALIGGNVDDNPCGNVTSSEKAAYEEKIRQLEHDIEWYRKEISHYEGENADMNSRYTYSRDFLCGQIKAKNKVILALAISLGVCLLAIIAALIIDRLDPSMGFFWLRSWLGTGNNPIKYIGS